MSSKKAKRKREYLESERKRKARVTFDAKYPFAMKSNLIEDMAATMGIKLK